jgi:hypothetical protein
LKPDTEDSDRFVLCSDRIVLECRCGESLILLGLEEDWHSERADFECRCGTSLTLANRSNEEVMAIKQLLREDIGIRASTISVSNSLSHRR